MRSFTLLAGRAVLGGYLAVHGAQKLFGAFGGHGLDATSVGFNGLGLTPSKPMAALAGGAELVGGVLTAAGIADPLGPIAIAGAMTVASAVHRSGGPLSSNGGYELPLTNLALAAVLVGTGPGVLKLSPRLPKRFIALVSLGAASLSGWSLFKLLTHKPPAPIVEALIEDIIES
ncbi:MAG: DoxX family protein [Ilumatobacteraceae bacterium]|nr:DoxX family protein [Ilumatobacteraceae bacterium]